jgi:glycosyltransferase involved in cell wall biosynthesis
MSSLPTVSILTPTYNRRHTFKLAIKNFYEIDYPQLKIEWIIVDDGTDSIEDMLPKDSRIKYYYIDNDKRKELYDEMCLSLDKNDNIKSSKKKKKNVLSKYHKKGFFHNRLPMGYKRNLCAKYAQNDFLIHMDDDDYYPAQSVQLRVSQLKKALETDNHCLFCTTVPNFDINQYKSILNNVGEKMPIDKGLSENTMAYTKKFWETQNYNNQDLCKEGTNFIKGRLRYCKVIDYREIIVALIHKTNFANRIKMPDGEPNGWAFNKLSDPMFLLITSFDDKIKQKTSESETNEKESEAHKKEDKTNESESEAHKKEDKTNESESETNEKVS